jgi:hypothetical protein
LVCITIVSGQTPFNEVAAAGAAAATALGEGTTDAAAAAEGEAAGLVATAEEGAGAALGAGAVVGLAAAGGAVVGAGGGAAAGAQPATMATAAIMGSVELSHGERAMRVPPLK